MLTCVRVCTCTCLQARFSDDIVYMLECLRVQLQTQLEGLEKLGQFTMQQRGLSLENFQLIEEVHQTLARVSLAGAWLREEVGVFGDTSGRCGGVLELLTERQAEVQRGRCMEGGRGRGKKEIHNTV